MTDDAKRAIAEFVADKDARIRALYKVKDKWGTVVTIEPNDTQQQLLDNCHTRNIIPKARQHGITTGVCIFKILDECLFNDHYKAAIIAHRESDALKIFASKIKFPYDSIPQFLKDSGFVPTATRVTTSSIEFSNGSIISADTMVRSDTLQILHISELAKMYAQFPQKAEEVRTGALPAAEKGQVFIESTMEGRFGLMYELAERAKALEDLGTPLTDKDFKFFFFPWHECKEYRMYTPVEIPQPFVEYFAKLAEDSGIHLEDEQKWWYVKEAEIQGETMKQEYPSTYRESTEVSGDAMFFGNNIVKARHEGRICTVPYDSNSHVYAAMDIGRSDSTAIWTFQLIRQERHFLEYFERDGEEPAFYHKWLSQREYPIKTLGLPHDAKALTLAASKSIEEIFRGFGYDVVILKRDDHEILGINDVRNAFNRCYIDKIKCARGLECLDKFRKEYDDKHCCYRTKSVHDEYSDGAKGFIYSIQLGNIMRNRQGSMSLDDYRALKASHRKII